MSLLTATAIGATATTIGGGLLYVSKSVLALIRKQDRQNDLLFGDGTPERPGLAVWQRDTTDSINRLDEGQRHIIRQTEQLRTDVDKANSQLVRNGGSSLRDVADRIEQNTAQPGSPPPPPAPRRPRTPRAPR